MGKREGRGVKVKGDGEKSWARGNRAGGGEVESWEGKQRGERVNREGK